jgi:mRNA interferase HigB
MRIIAKSTLKRFWQQSGCADARGPLESWHEEALKAVWKSPLNRTGFRGGLLA